MLNQNKEVETAMQNAKLGILATIGLVGLSILAGCQKPATTPPAAQSEAPAKATGPQPNKLAPAPPGTRWFAVELHEKDGTLTSTPDTVTLSMGLETPLHKPDRIVWVAMGQPTDEPLVVCFNTDKGNPFENGRPKPHGGPVRDAKSFVVPKGEAVLSGALRPDVADGHYKFVVTEQGQTCPPSRPTKDGDVIIKR